MDLGLAGLERHRHRRHQGHRSGDRRDACRRGRERRHLRPPRRRRRRRRRRAGRPRACRRPAGRSTWATARPCRSGSRRRRRARRHRHRRLQRVGARHRRRRGLLEERVRDRHDGRGAPRRRGHAVPRALERRRRSSPSPASRAGRSTSPSGAYGAFKAALVHYTQGLAYQLAGKGIRANTVSPGNTYFPGGVWSQIETGNPELFRWRSGSTRPGGWARRRRWPTPWPSSPARRQLHHRHQPRRRRCADQRRPALTIAHVGVGRRGWQTAGDGRRRTRSAHAQRRGE